MTWLAPMPPSHVATSCGKGGVEITLHTSPSHCKQKTCLYIVVRVLLWHMQHRTREWSKPSPAKTSAMLGRECRAMFDMAAAWVQTPGNNSLSHTGWGPAVLK